MKDNTIIDETEIEIKIAFTQDEINKLVCSLNRSNNYSLVKYARESDYSLADLDRCEGQLWKILREYRNG